MIKKFDLVEVSEYGIRTLVWLSKYGAVDHDGIEATNGLIGIVMYVNNPEELTWPISVKWIGTLIPADITHHTEKELTIIQSIKNN